ncbi:oxidoreductase [Jiella endophytica]|uniref:Oxidoreductase n=1 Tax=Jiella endophytica TaxID=2558362 RepID=A0A4Y8RPB1_9HYPH|nr:oxidoreductase [Jiella endophytica]TFF25151.1 oxidoreductase [Jiella endophytica]
MAISRRTFISGCALTFLSANVGHAAVDLDDPALPVLKVMRGGAPLASFSRMDLAAMPQTAFETKTPWNDGPTSYEGPLLADFLAHVGANATQLRLLALNDYLVLADVALLVDGGAILAIKEDGDFLPTARKGPVFMMFPFDSDRRLHSQQFYSRAVWQLIEIDLQ